MRGEARGSFFPALIPRLQSKEEGKIRMHGWLDGNGMKTRLAGSGSACVQAQEGGAVADIFPSPKKKVL